MRSLSAKQPLSETHSSHLFTPYEDFWTTRCTRCPAALDKLNALASKYGNEVNFVSICCDKLDGAREIIERDDEKKWQSMNHYFMSHNNKEYCKQALKFAAVPFYVVIKDDVTIVECGNKVNVEAVLGKELQQGATDDKENDIITDSAPAITKEVSPVVEPADEPVLIIDDLDF